MYTAYSLDSKWRRKIKNHAEQRSPLIVTAPAQCPSGHSGQNPQESAAAHLLLPENLRSSLVIDKFWSSQQQIDTAHCCHCLKMTEMRLVYTDTEALFVSFKTYWLSKRYVPSLTHISLNTVFPGAFLLLFLHHMATCMSTPTRVFFHSFIPVIFLSQNSNSLWWRKCRMQLRGWQGCFPRSCLLKEISVHFLHTFLAGNVPVNHGCLCWLESIWNHIPIGFTMSNAKIFYILLNIY